MKDLPKRIAVCNDLHFNFLGESTRQAFIKSIDADAIIIAGDIGTAPTVCTFLSEFKIPTYFCLGNHSAYHGSLYETREKVAHLADNSPNLCYLSDQLMVTTGYTQILGVDSWADGRLGDYANSTVQLNDFVYVSELQVPKHQQLYMMQRFADEAAQQLSDKLAQVTAKNIVVVSHVPPFESACKYRGKPTDPYFLPFFSWKVGGDVLLAFATLHPETSVLVISGHTHYACEVDILPNLHVSVGAAKYGAPCVNRYLEL